MRCMCCVDSLVYNVVSGVWCVVCDVVFAKYVMYDEVCGVMCGVYGVV